MTYKELYDLKYKKRVSTYDLVCRYPKDIRRVSEVALLEVPEETLGSILPKKSVLKKLLGLKSKLMRNTSRKKRRLKSSA